MAKEIKPVEAQDPEQGAELAASFDKMDNALATSEAFIEKNSKTLLIVLAAVALAVVGIIIYIKNVRTPRIAEANAAIAKAQQAFARDSFQLALDGNADFEGFLAVADEYSGTDAADLANAYIGLCYKRLGNNEDAVAYLEKFSASDSKAVEPAILGAIGDCYADMANISKATSYYKKAINSENSLIAPIYMQRLAILKMDESKEESVNILKQIKEEYPESVQAAEADKYISFINAK